MFRIFLVIFLFFINNIVFSYENADYLMKKHLKKPKKEISKENYYIFRENGFKFDEDKFIEQYDKSVKKVENKDKYKITGFLDFEHSTSLKDKFGKYEDGNLKLLTTRFNVKLERNIYNIGNFVLSADIRSIRQNITYNDPFIDEDYEIYECYYEKLNKNWKVKFGRQLIFWNSDFLISEADPFPEYKIKPPWDTKEKKIPLWSVITEHNIFNVNIQSLFIPGFQKEREAPINSIWEDQYSKYIQKLKSYSGNTVEKEEYNKNFPSDGSYGFRIIKNTKKIHTTLSYLTYLSVRPTIYKKDLFISNNEFIPKNSLVKHERNMSLFFTSSAKLTKKIKGYFELSYNFNDMYSKKANSINDFKSFDDSVESCHSIHTSLGFDKKYNDLFNLKLQFFANNIFNKNELETSSYIGGISYNIYGNILTDKFTYLLEGIRYSYEQSYFHPELNYKFNNKYNINFGYYFYSGQNYDEPFGQYQDNDQIYCGIRYHL